MTPIYECHGGPLDGAFKRHEEGDPPIFYHEGSVYGLMKAVRHWPRHAELTFWSYRGTDEREIEEFPVVSPDFPQ